MKLLSLGFNETLTKLTINDGATIVAQAVSCLEVALRLQDVQLSEVEYVNKYGPVDDYGFAQLDLLEECAMDLDYEQLDNFSRSMAASTENTARRIRSAVHYLEILEKVIAEITGPFLPPTSEHLEKLKQVTLEIIGELSYFIYYEFKVDITLNSLEAGDLLVNVSLHQYLDQRNQSVAEFSRWLEEIVMKYRPVLTIFEALPELEDEFYEIAGPHLRDFDAISKYLTAEAVLMVLAGKEDVEKVLRELENSIIEL